MLVDAVVAVVCGGCCGGWREWVLCTVADQHTNVVEF